MKFDHHNLSYGEDLYQQAQTGGTDLAGFLDDIFGAAKQAVSYATTKAAELGVKTPLDSEIERLRAGRDKLKANRLTAESMLNTMVSKIEFQKTIQSARIADQLKQEAGIAIGQTGVAITYYANAITKGLDLLDSIKRGAPSGQLAAEYAIQKNLAFQHGAATESKYQAFFNHVREGTDLVFGISASQITPEKLIEQGKESIAQLVGTATPYAGAIPWVVGGLLTLYALNTIGMFVPRRR